MSKGWISTAKRTEIYQTSKTSRTERPGEVFRAWEGLVGLRGWLGAGSDRAPRRSGRPPPRAQHAHEGSAVPTAEGRGEERRELQKSGLRWTEAGRGASIRFARARAESRINTPRGQNATR